MRQRAMAQQLSPVSIPGIDVTWQDQIQYDKL
jgi:hypothetical protein